MPAHQPHLAHQDTLAAAAAAGTGAGRAPRCADVGRHGRWVTAGVRSWARAGVSSDGRGGGVCSAGRGRWWARALPRPCGRVPAHRPGGGPARLLQRPCAEPPAGAAGTGKRVDRRVG
eukprot:365894-Chlamydomonas_euryale.AAC.5